MRVIKFGGTSIGTPERFLNVVKIISSKSERDNVLVVLSAIGGVTDKIIEAAEWAERGDKNYQSIFGEIKTIHKEFLATVVKEPFILPTEQKLNQFFTTLFEKLRGVYLLNECSPRVSDSIITLGEYLSNTLLVNSLRSFGKDAEFYDARDFIKTDSTFGDASVDFGITNQLIQNKFSSVSKNHIPVINGFTGSNENGDTTTLGRSGSDYTATIIGGALKAELVEIWTDVDGVLSADPKIVSEAHTLDELSYQHAGSLAILGGKVIHPKTIAPVEKKNVPVSILNTFRPEIKGTNIGCSNEQNNEEIKTITYLNGLSSINIFSPESKYGQKILARLFGLIARIEIPIVAINKSAYNQTISFIVSNEFENSFLEEIKREFVLEIEKGLIGEILSRNNLSLISAIGVDRSVTSLVTRKIYDVLENNGIDSLVFLNDPGLLNISFIVDTKDLNKTVIVLHDEFFEKPAAVNVA